MVRNKWLSVLLAALLTAGPGLTWAQAQGTASSGPGGGEAVAAGRGPGFMALSKHQHEGHDGDIQTEIGDMRDIGVGGPCQEQRHQDAQPCRR